MDLFAEICGGFRSCRFNAVDLAPSPFSRAKSVGFHLARGEAMTHFSSPGCLTVYLDVLDKVNFFSTTFGR